MYANHAAMQFVSDPKQGPGLFFKLILGSIPDIAGQDKVNPSVAVLSATKIWT
ncbi:putative 3-isopropylmalate dehydrogenase [Dioscorea sansibarensis]